MDVQTPLPSTKPATETASQLKPSALQALVASPSLILAGKLLKKFIGKNMALKLPNMAPGWLTFQISKLH